MVLTPNPNWYGATPTLQRLEIHIGGDPASAVEAWERGDLDEVPVPSSDVARVLAIPEYASMINRTAQQGIEYYDFATCQHESLRTPCPRNDAVTEGIVGGAPTQNVHFRRALTQAIDKADLIHQTYGGVAIPAFSPTMPGIPGFPTVTADNTPLPFDPSTALVDMGTALGELGVAEPDPADVLPATGDCAADCQHSKAWVRVLGPLRFGYNCDSGHDAQVLYVAVHWRDVLGFRGDQLDVRCTDNGLWRGPTINFYDIRRNGWGADFPHPDNQNRDLFACGVGNNSSGYCNPVYDALLNQGAAAATYDASLPFYRQAEQQLVQDAPVLFLRYPEAVRLVRPWLVYTQSASDHQNVGDALYEDFQVLAH
jgi:ABC-type oligopeptide transport system substrate-binding subunit